MEKQNPASEMEFTKRLEAAGLTLARVYSAHSSDSQTAIVQRIESTRRSGVTTAPSCVRPHDAGGGMCGSINAHSSSVVSLA
jgi:hypothetical protein